ncbi:MAG TPA: 23S rRNA (adenine(2503)-C(2))-methyltransferase RlmN [Anaerolineae bacterium]|nr:23S rRNA (adenine(2503)-C(2))-methyltransferase RlmN [Anaerolineae bacterium]
MSNSRPNIKSLPREELRTRMALLGLKPYRADQVLKWIYSGYASSFDNMTNIAKSDRTILSEAFVISAPTIAGIEVSSDGTRKFLFQLEDRHTIESVLIPDEDRQTLCISSQVGCRQACRFCLTGSGGFVRDLQASEIADQVLEVSRILKQEGERGITNIVLMGMGEPLANFDEVMKALIIITSEPGLGFSPRRVTVSTDGLVPEIGRLGSSGVKVNLAVSLNATTDEVRDRLMPVNRRYPIKALLDACRRFPLEPRRRITFEYVMLKGVNDTVEDALRLAKLLRGIKCKVNLIPFNPFPGSEFRRPDDAAVRRFQKVLLDRHYTSPVRESRGRDISAACGQLREKEAAASV